MKQSLKTHSRKQIPSMNENKKSQRQFYILVDDVGLLFAPRMPVICPRIVFLPPGNTLPGRGGNVAQNGWKRVILILILVIHVVI